MPVPNQFANVTTSIPLSQLDANFNTPITLGNTAIQLGNTVTTLNNMTLANVTISSGNVTITNVSVTTANVTTANITTAIITTANVATANVTTSQILNYGTANGVAYLNASKALTTGTGLTFNGSTLFELTTANQFPIISVASTGTNSIFGYRIDGSGGNGRDWRVEQGRNAAGQFNITDITAGNLVRVAIDNSGNLGLGVTPSAWGSTSKALTVRSTGSGIEGSIATSGATNAISLVSNGYYNAGWKYVYSGGSFSAGRYDIEGAGHSWYTAASGTAGNAITFTQAMTLDASGNLLVGKTSGAGYRFELSGNGMYLTGSAGYNAYFGQANIFMTTGSGTDTAIRSDTNLLFGAGGSTERMRIDASGFTQFSGNLVMPYQGAPTSKAAAATLSGAELITGILNTTGTTYTITLPTGANIEGALTWSANNVSLDWYVINTASGTITIGANGNTTLGSLTIATGTSAHFRIRRTAANTFTVYRL